MKERVHLRPYQEKDEAGLYAYLSQENVVKYEPYGCHTVEEAKETLADRIKAKEFLAIARVDNDELIGNVYFDKMGPDHFETWMVGYVVNQDYWGKGYGSEALRLLLHKLFEDHKAHRVVAFCHADNENSWKLLERSGFRREGHRKKNAYFKRDDQGQPIWHDSYQYALLREEWLND